MQKFSNLAACVCAALKQVSKVIWQMTTSLPHIHFYIVPIICNGRAYIAVKSAYAGGKSRHRLLQGYWGPQKSASKPHSDWFVRFAELTRVWWFGSRVVSVLDSGTEGPRFKSQSRRCRVTVLGKLFTPIVPLFAKQQNW